MERVFHYTEEEVSHEYERLVPLEASHDADNGSYTIHVENTTDWDRETRSVRTVYRAVTSRKTIDHNGMEMPYNQYLTNVAKQVSVFMHPFRPWMQAVTSYFRHWFIQVRPSPYRMAVR